MIKNFRDMIVWQKAMSLVTEIYKETGSFTNSEVYGLTSQIRRSAVSIPSNIAEGFGRKTKPDFINFLHIARGSLYELQTQTEIAKNLEFIPKPKFAVLFELCSEVERLLNGLIHSVKNKIQ